MANIMKYKAVWVAAFAACLIAACFAIVPAAFANQQLNAPTTVSDDITRIHVSKLDADTHEFVEGAAMQIIEKDTGTVVDEWITGAGVHQNEKGLDVDKVYILREISAPDGYEVVKDTEFVVNATEGTGITILSGDDASLTESYKVSLYDKPIARVNEQVVTQTRETNNTTTQGTPSNTTTSGTTKPAPKTGDETPLALIAGLCVGGLWIIALLQLAKRRLRRTEE